jgi:hypothetical protein
MKLHVYKLQQLIRGRRRAHNIESRHVDECIQNLLKQSPTFVLSDSLGHSLKSESLLEITARIQ